MSYEEYGEHGRIEGARLASLAACAVIMVVLAVLAATGNLKYMWMGEVYSVTPSAEEVEDKVYALLCDVQLKYAGNPNLTRVAVLDEAAKAGNDAFVNGVKHYMARERLLRAAKELGLTGHFICGEVQCEGSKTALTDANEIARQVVDTWLKSPEHRAIITRPAQYVGIAASISCRNGICDVYVTADFISVGG